MKRYMTMGAMMTLLLTTGAAAQQYSVPWHTADGGGTTAATGGGFRLAGTAGQPDAGFMAGNGFELAGGFWPGVATGDDCNGGETINKAKCKTKNGQVKKAIVKLKNGTPGMEYTARLDTGQEVTKKAKSSGKVTLKFSGGDSPPCGPNAVTIEPCGLREEMSCNCE